MNLSSILQNLVKLLVHKPIQKLTSTLLAGVLIVCTSFVVWSKDAQADHFQCYTGCSHALENSNECRKSERRIPGDYDYAAVDRTGREEVVVLAIHAGAIELNTGQIAKAISSENNWDSYTFRGHIRNSDCKALVSGSTKPNFDVLHITSKNFDDPIAIELVRSHKKTVSIHGHSQPHASGSICVGGLNKYQRDEFITYVKSNASSFKPYMLNPIDAPTQTSGDCSEKNLKGKSPDNIVNKNSAGKGLQLELNAQMRKDLVKSDTDYKELQRIIYGAVAQAMTK
jgi:phage replication-related protein YjqB (UPF0714/DUF867 family)